MKRIAIIGGGIVGSTISFYLTKSKDYKITLFDDDHYQATKAAVGIICPWLNQRRNKFWYYLVRDGAEFYDRLIEDLSDTSFYKRVGAVYINPKMEERMLKIGKKRAEESYKVGKVTRVTKNSHPDLLPDDFQWTSGIHVSGGARVDGKVLVERLITKSISQGLTFVNEKVSVKEVDGAYVINGQTYDQLVIAAGAHLKEVLSFKKEYNVDIHQQKGQLIGFDLKSKNQYPVVMPKGEIDFLFGENGELVVGGSHENDFTDLNIDKDVLFRLKNEAIRYYPKLSNYQIEFSRLGLRAQTSTYTPFYGNLAKDPNIYVVGGLGSSGLTSGPIMAYRIAMSIMDEGVKNRCYFNVDKYVTKK